MGKVWDERSGEKSDSLAGNRQGDLSGLRFELEECGADNILDPAAAGESVLRRRASVLGERRIENKIYEGDRLELLLPGQPLSGK